MTVLQSTPLTLGLSSKRVVVLDALRRQRNVSDYTGEDVDESTAENCIVEVVAWRASHRPELVPKVKS